jgi:hypothetical protein
MPEDISAVNNIQKDNMRGYRLLVSLVDEFAEKDPSRVWAAVPVDDRNLLKGFKDITYKILAEAVDRAVVWLQKTLPAAQVPFETIAYCQTTKDLSYPILAIAVAKIGRKVTIENL